MCFRRDITKNIIVDTRRLPQHAWMRPELTQVWRREFEMFFSNSSPRSSYFLVFHTQEKNPVLIHIRWAQKRGSSQQKENCVCICKLKLFSFFLVMFQISDDDMTLFKYLNSDTIRTELSLLSFHHLYFFPSCFIILLWFHFHFELLNFLRHHHKFVSSYSIREKWVVVLCVVCGGEGESRHRIKFNIFYFFFCDFYLILILIYYIINLIKKMCVSDSSCLCYMIAILNIYIILSYDTMLSFWFDFTISLFLHIIKIDAWKISFT